MTNNCFQEIVACVGLLFCTLLTMSSCRSVTSVKLLKEFKLDTPTSRKIGDDKIVSVVQSPEDYIYLATKYTVKKLDSNLTLILDRKIVTDGPNTEINLLLLRGSADLIICISDEEGICELWDLSTLHQTLDRYKRSMVINSWGGLTVSWITKTDINGSDVINVALPTTFQNPAGPTIPLLSTRILPQRGEPNDKFLALIEDEYGSPKSFLSPVPCLKTEIKPVNGFSTSRFNYFLKRHRNENGPLETKLARVCSGSSTYRSLIELPLECHHGNESADFTERELSSAYFTNEELYAVFTTNSEASQVESIICRYNINQINKQFTERRRECLLGQTETTELEWYQYNTCPSKPVPSSKFNISQLDDPNFCYDLDTAYPLGGRNPILGAPLDSLQMTEVITAILVVQKPDEEVYLLGDNRGYIHKISSTGNREVVLFDLENDFLSPNGFFLSNDKTTVYATGNGKVMALPLIGSWTTTQTPQIPGDDHDDDDGNSIRLWVLVAVILVILALAIILTGLCVIYCKRST